MTRVMVVAALLALPLAAAPNLSGNWVLNLAKSQYGQFPAPEIMIRKIQHKDPALSELKCSTDGKPVVNGENQGSAHWENDKLVIETSRDYQETKLTQREEWTLSADGKTLTIATHVKLPNGEFDVKQVFEKVQ